jgi:predicted PurR-regulated permease PerM
MLNKRGNLPVTLLVILTLVLFTVVLAAFSVKIINLSGEVSSVLSSVNQYSSSLIDSSYLSSEAEPVIKMKSAWFSEPRLEIRVSKIP